MSSVEIVALIAIFRFIFRIIKVSKEKAKNTDYSSNNPKMKKLQNNLGDLHSILSKDIKPNKSEVKSKKQEEESFSKNTDDF